MFMGCKKEEKKNGNDDKKTGPGADFTWTGGNYVYSPITFKSDAPAGTKHTWYFGNYDVSQEESPTYSYDCPCWDSVFIVRLLVNGVETKKELRLMPGVERLLAFKDWTKVYTRHFVVLDAGNNPVYITDTTRIADTSFVLGLSADSLGIMLPREKYSKHVPENSIECRTIAVDKKTITITNYYGAPDKTSAVFNIQEKKVQLYRQDRETLSTLNDTGYSINYFSK
jgi:hypothetical protein